MKNFLGIVLVLSFFPFCLSFFGLPGSWLAGEGVDSSDLYVAAISIPAFVLSYAGIILIERRENRDHLALKEFEYRAWADFDEQLRREYERGYNETL